MRSSTSGWWGVTCVLALLVVSTCGRRRPEHDRDAGPDAARPAPRSSSVTCRAVDSLTARASVLLGLPEDFGDLVDLRDQVVSGLGVEGGLRARAAGELARVVDQRV